MHSSLFLSLLAPAAAMAEVLSIWNIALPLEPPRPNFAATTATIQGNTTIMTMGCAPSYCGSATVTMGPSTYHLEEHLINPLVNTVPADGTVDCTITSAPSRATAVCSQKLAIPDVDKSTTSMTTIEAANKTLVLQGVSAKAPVTIVQATPAGPGGSGSTASPGGAAPTRAVGVLGVAGVLAGVAAVAL